MTSWKKPTPDQVAKARLALGRPESAFYFFDKLANPLWIDPLTDLGFFQHPPAEVRDGDRISFPIWPAARYLARMATEGEEAAAAAINAILKAGATENHLVHLSYVDLALAAPAATALPLAQQERRWLANQTWLYAQLPEKFAELAAHLLQGGCKDEAFTLAATLLAFLPNDADTKAGTRDDPTARFDAWEYEQVLKRIVAGFQQSDALGTVALLCNLLFECAKRHGRGLSYVWRPAIEEDDQNWDLDRIPDLLIDTLRDLCEAVVRSDPGALEPVLAELIKREKKQGIFRRLRLHLVRVFRVVAGPRARAALLDTTQLDDLEVLHEYALLMRDEYSDLSEAEQSALLAAISRGPDARKDLSNPEAQAEFDRYSRIWKRNHLAMIEEKLPSDWAAVYGSLVDELGPPAHPEFATYHSPKFWTGPQSPKTRQELAGMSPEALIEYLIVWRPTRDFMAPSPEGLGRVLEEVAADEPAKFVGAIQKLQRLHPVYVRSIVAGLAKALKQGKHVDWEPALSLATWCVRQEQLPYALPGDFTDPDWTWTRKAVIDLLTAGMTAKPEFPIEARMQFWEALRPLLDDPNPTPSSENIDSENFDPGTVALNTVRGSAFHALVQFALWIRRWQESQADAASRGATGFAELPEVRDALDAHLDPSHDASLAVRSVYGQWFPWLVMLDASWAQSAAPRIFPVEPALSDLRDSAWQAYLAHNPPYRNVVAVLHREYVQAADRLASVRKVRVRALRPAEQALGEHVLVMYARAWIENGDPALVSFFAHAPVDTRVAVLSSVGRDLMAREDGGPDSGPRIPTEVVKRLQEFWDSRLQSPGRDKRESEAFGWWFAAGVFDVAWSWKRLIAAITDAGRVGGHLFLARRLAAIGAASPADAIFVLDALISNAAEPWTVLELKDAIRPVLVAALGADGPTRETAIRLINRLGERGFGEYKELLPEFLPR
jgi:hypothetical protein